MNNYLVVRKRETEAPEVYPFETYHDAWRFWDTARLQWTDTYLCEVLKPVRPLTHAEKVAMKYADRCDELNRKMGVCSHDAQSCAAELHESTES
jgi:hypothetical protein